MDIKSFEELEEELCDYCPLCEESKGVHCYGGEPIFCVDSGCCEIAYENYKEAMKENMDLEKIKDKIYNQQREMERNVDYSNDVRITREKINKKFEDEFNIKKHGIETNYKPLLQKLENQISQLQNNLCFIESVNITNELFRSCNMNCPADFDKKQITQLNNTIKKLNKERTKLETEKDEKIKILEKEIGEEREKAFNVEYNKIKKFYEK